MGYSNTSKEFVRVGARTINGKSEPTPAPATRHLFLNTHSLTPHGNALTQSTRSLALLLYLTWKDRRSMTVPEKHMHSSIVGRGRNNNYSPSCKTQLKTITPFSSAAVMRQLYVPSLYSILISFTALTIFSPSLVQGVRVWCKTMHAQSFRPTSLPPSLSIPYNLGLE